MARKPNTKPPKGYELIQCGNHQWRPWYITCVHVANEGKPIDHYKEASVKDCGEALCEECSKTMPSDEPNIDLLIPVCDLCMTMTILPKVGRINNQ